MGIFFNNFGSVKLFGFIEELLDNGVFPLDGVDAGVVLVAPVPTLRWSLVVLNIF